MKPVDPLPQERIETRDLVFVYGDQLWWRAEDAEIAVDRVYLTIDLRILFSEYGAGQEWLLRVRSRKPIPC
jgi:hypothetical protein